MRLMSRARIQKKTNSTSTTDTANNPRKLQKEPLNSLEPAGLAVIFTAHLESNGEMFSYQKPHFEAILTDTETDLMIYITISSQSPETTHKASLHQHIINISYYIYEYWKVIQLPPSFPSFSLTSVKAIPLLLISNLNLFTAVKWQLAQ